MRERPADQLALGLGGAGAAGLLLGDEAEPAGAAAGTSTKASVKSSVVSMIPLPIQCPRSRPRSDMLRRAPLPTSTEGC